MLARSRDSEALRWWPLTRATTIGPYKVLELLGVGGWVSVDLARDTRLGRKMLSNSYPLSSPKMRTGRFQQEARAASALTIRTDNHFEIGEVESVHFISTDSSRANPPHPQAPGGCRPWNSADVAIQVASALTARTPRE